MITPARWWRKVRRRRPGIYAYRTRRHLRAGVEWGYVGKSVQLEARHLDHEGKGRYGHAAKPWIDLVARVYRLRLPWWLGWSWVLLPLEAAVIVALRPRYNDRGNPRRDKVRKIQQEQQRMERARWGSSAARAGAAHWANRMVRTVAILMILVGVGGWLWTR